MELIRTLVNSDTGDISLVLSNPPSLLLHGNESTNFPTTLPPARPDVATFGMCGSSNYGAQTQLCGPTININSRPNVNGSANCGRAVNYSVSYPGAPAPQNAVILVCPVVPMRNDPLQGPSLSYHPSLAQLQSKQSYQHQHHQYQHQHQHQHQQQQQQQQQQYQRQQQPMRPYVVVPDRRSPCLSIQTKDKALGVDVGVDVDVDVDVGVGGVGVSMVDSAVKRMELRRNANMQQGWRKNNEASLYSSSSSNLFGDDARIAATDLHTAAVLLSSLSSETCSGVVSNAHVDDNTEQIQLLDLPRATAAAGYVVSPPAIAKYKRDCHFERSIPAASLPNLALHVSDHDIYPFDLTARRESEPKTANANSNPNANDDDDDDDDGNDNDDNDNDEERKKINDPTLFKHPVLGCCDASFQCTECGRCYQSEKGLKRHERIHDPATRGCPYCHKKFARKSYLYDHIRTHTGEKPYPCPSCHKSFACKRNLNQHIRTHSNVKRYCCAWCDRKFRVNQSLKVHLAKVHQQ